MTDPVPDRPPPIDYASPMPLPPEPDLEYSFGCFPALAGGGLTVFAWVCAGITFLDSFGRPASPASFALAASTAAASIGLVISRRSSGAWFGWPLIVISLPPWVIAARTLLP